MVSLNGAIAAEPIVAQINILQVAVNQLAAALTANDIIGRMTLQVFAPGGQSSSTIDILYTLNLGDSQAILNDIKNVLNNDINILTNQLGAIT